MIRDHAFNTAWWGAPVGIVADPDFFALPETERQALTAPYAWIEYNGPMGGPAAPKAIHDAGFFMADAQVNFRLDLAKVPASSWSDTLEVIDATEAAFSFTRDAVQPFQNERFRFLPGATQDRIDARFLSWAGTLIAEAPRHALAIRHEGRVQGWFFSRPEGKRLNLTLAAAARDGVLSGMALYQAALRHYADLGHRTGHAAFSLTNTPVHNIYAALQARFLDPRMCWLCTDP